ncbi:MAG: serine hydrolase [Firmicutes bacterium]|nr:serine hydrolase [Bacillota bacterium]MCM1400660.1 serine hydrolase [Bacteroides sp.]MCM1476351.1 serine hydrolase [Bacteroides sp.]
MRGNLESRIDDIVRKSISAGAMPGCQVLVAKGGQVVIDKAYGTLNRGGSAKVNNETLFDVASMSKVCGTLSALMKSYDQGKWKLNDPIAKYLPELKEKPLGKVTMEELLYHQSGLPASLNIFEVVLDTATYSGPAVKYRYGAPYTIKIQEDVYGNKDARLRSDIFSSEKSEKFHLPVAKGIYASDEARAVIMDSIYNIEPKAKKYLYSDLNFCLLMQIQENITGVPHDRWVTEQIFLPLGAQTTGYNPSMRGLTDNVAPTEVDNYLRRQHVKGYVHDETAAFSGGVQGNAGLFTTAHELAPLFQTWLNGGVYGGKRIYSEETVELFTGSKSKISDRGLGFDRLVSKKAWGVSPETYGHTGFTGTCFWIDPTRNLIYIFLSNRVNPTRDNKAFTKSNPRNNILKAVYDSMN